MRNFYPLNYRLRIHHFEAALIIIKYNQINLKQQKMNFISDIAHNFNENRSENFIDSQLNLSYEGFTYKGASANKNDDLKGQ